MSGSAGEPQAPGAAASSPAPRRRGRGWLIGGGLALALLLVLTVLVPRFAAGWLAAQQLERMGIANRGVTSLDIDLLHSRINLGAVEFWAADAVPGQVADVSLTYGLSNLFAGRALIDQLRISGIDLRVTRDEDGSITVNGIELADLLGPPEEPDTRDQATEDDRSAAFGIGLDGFLLEDSRVLLETATGGTLLVEVDRMVVEDMRSWDPDHPAVIGLTARVNDIGLKAEAQANLFSDTIMVDGHVRLDSVDLDKVTRYTGPLGFERRDGEVGADLALSVQIEPNGRMVMAAYGDVTHDGAELVRPELSYRVAHQKVDLDGVLIAEPVAAAAGGDAAIVLRAAGDARMEASQVQVNAPGAPELTFDQANIDLAHLVAMRDPQGRITLQVEPSLEVKAPAASGPVGVKTDRVALAMPTLAVTVDGEAIAVRAAGSGDVDKLSLALADPAGGPGSVASAGSLRATFDDLALSLAPGRSGITGRVGLDVDALAAKLGGAAGGPATSVELSSARAEIADLDAGLAGSGRTEVSGRATFGFKKLTAEASVAEGTAAISAGALDVALSALDLVVAEGRSQLGVTGTSELSGVQVQLADGSNLELGRLGGKLDALGVTLDPSGRIAASGGVALTLAEAAAGLPFGDGTAQGTLDELGLTLTGLDLAMSQDGGATLTTAGSTELKTLQATAPAAAGRPPATISLAGLGVTLDRLAADMGGASPTWNAALSVAAESLDAAITGDGAGSVRLGSLALEGLQVDQAPAVDARSVTLAGLEVELSDRTVKALAAGSKSAPATPEAPADGGGAAVRLDQVSIERPAVIRYTDTAVEPAFEVEAELGAEVAHLDTTDPSQRTDLRVAGAINQKAELTLSGWATSATPPDFDLDLDLRRLQLPPLSPYAANAVGMDIESGVFGTATKAAASDGALKGKIDLEVDDLILVPVSEAAAEKASAAVGVPVSAVVGLLEDSEGKIKLGLPIGGTVDAPEIDPSEAISKVIAGTLTSVFPPTAIAGMLMSEGGSVEFQPITFQAGSAVLDDEGRKVVDGFVALLNAKPRLDVLPCGRATAADTAGPAPPPPAPAVSAANPASSPAAPAAPATPAAVADTSPEAMLELAKARAAAVETYLVEERKIAPERVRECRPRFDPDGSGPPRVDLTLT